MMNWQDEIMIFVGMGRSLERIHNALSRLPAASTDNYEAQHLAGTIKREARELEKQAASLVGTLGEVAKKALDAEQKATSK